MFNIIQHCFLSYPNSLTNLKLIINKYSQINYMTKKFTSIIIIILLKSLLFFLIKQTITTLGLQSMLVDL